MRRALFSTFALIFSLALSSDGFGDHDAPLGPAPDFKGELQHAEAVASYTLQVRLDPQTHRLVGTGTITLRNISGNPLNEVWVHLYLNAFKNDRSVFLREQNGGGRGNRGGGHGSQTDSLQQITTFDHGGLLCLQIVQ